MRQEHLFQPLVEGVAWGSWLDSRDRPLPEAQIFGGDEIPTAGHERLFHGIFQLSDIPWPCVRAQGFKRLGGKATDRTPQLPAVARQEMLSQQGYISLPRA